MLTATLQRLYVGETERLLESEALGFSPNCFMSSATKASFLEQLTNYKKIVKSHQHRANSVSYSGKSSGPDDLAVTLGLGCWALHELMRGRLAGSPT